MADDPTSAPRIVLGVLIPRNGLAPAGALTTMPLYEYRCDSCGNDFEALVRSSNDAPSCPSCKSSMLTKQFSIPASARAPGASSSSSLPVCDAPVPAGACGAMGCGGGFCGMDN